MTDLSIIIVNWNSTAFLLKCLESIYAHSAGAELEIIVVDNASPDRDIWMIRERYEDVVVIESPVNLGFARANNLGFLASRGEYVVFLNPDTLLINPAFDLMLRQVRLLPTVGAVGCKLLNEDQSVQTSAIQTFPTILNQLLDLDFVRNRFPGCPLWNIAPLFDASTEPCPVEVISGACILFRRDAFAQIGQFSEEYFMYAEDLDLCYKAAKAGFTNYYIPQGRIIHYGGKSSVRRKAVVMKWNSILQYVAKHRGNSYQLVFRMAILCSALARVITLIALVAVTEGARRNAVRGTLLKWWLILNTMLTHFEDKPKVEGFATEEAPQGVSMTTSKSAD